MDSDATSEPSPGRSSAASSKFGMWLGPQILGDVLFCGPLLMILPLTWPFHAQFVPVISCPIQSLTPAAAAEGS